MLTENVHTQETLGWTF